MLRQLAVVAAGIRRGNLISNMLSIENVLPLALDWLRRGERLCLATLVYVDGSAPRPLGAQMLIAESGAAYGYLSGGCAEHAIADIGRACFTSGHNTVARFGAGSAYLDIQLPCGAGIDVHYVVDPDAASLAALTDAQAARRVAAFEVAVGVANGVDDADNDSENDSESDSGAFVTNIDSELAENHYRRIYYPPIQLQIVGAGPVALALAEQGQVQGFSVTLLTPDAATRADAPADCPVKALRDRADIQELAVDEHTAIVTAFHEHERELDVWTELASSPAFYLGALGSRRAHQERLTALAQLGVNAPGLERIHGPAGLATGGKTAAEIALSIIAQLRAEYRRRDWPDLLWSGGALEPTRA